MNKLTATLCLTLTLLLGSVSMSWSADFQKGMTAYRSGDYATALREWTPLAEQGYALAQFNLGNMYRQGKGVPQNYKTAVKWYELAAEQGHAYAQYNIGVMYQNGNGVKQNYKTAVKYFHFAAISGNSNAQFALGAHYHKGKGVEIEKHLSRFSNYAFAAMWYSLAVEQGHSTSKSHLKALLVNESVLKKKNNLGLKTLIEVFSSHYYKFKKSNT